MADRSDDDARDGGLTEQALQELLRAEHHRAAIDARRRRGELQRQAVESMTLLDAARHLASGGGPITVHTQAGETTASVVEVGRDYLALRGPGTETRLVPLGAVTAVQSATGVTGASAPIPSPALSEPGTSLHERLTELALRRPQVHAAFAGGATTGQLRQVGVDLLVIAAEGSATEVVVALSAVDHVAL